jgi:hypothetical protein
MKKHRPRQCKPKPRIAKPAPAERREDGSLVFYHGGAGVLGVGDYLLPRALTGDPGSRAEWSDEWVKDAGLEDYEDDDFVFVTTNYKLAVRHAVLYRSGHGKLYEVIPEGTLEPDPARRQDCFRCSRAKIVAIKPVPWKLEQRIRSERPRENFKEAFDVFNQFVKDDPETLRRAQENALIAGQRIIEQKVGELATSDLSPRFIATELMAHAIRMVIPSCEMLLARVLAARHWEQVLATLPAQMRA